MTYYLLVYRPRPWAESPRHAADFPFAAVPGGVDQLWERRLDGGWQEVVCDGRPAGRYVGCPLAFHGAVLESDVPPDVLFAFPPPSDHDAAVAAAEALYAAAPDPRRRGDDD